MYKSIFLLKINLRKLHKKWYNKLSKKDNFNIKGRTDGEVTFIDIELKECTLHGIRLVDGKSGTFLAPPSYKKGEKWYHYFFITKELSDAVLKALKEFDKTLVKVGEK